MNYVMVLTQQTQIAQAFAELVAQLQRPVNINSSSINAQSVSNNQVVCYTGVSPVHIKRLVSKRAPHFLGYGQHDCQEFMRYDISACVCVYYVHDRRAYEQACVLRLCLWLYLQIFLST